MPKAVFITKCLPSREILVRLHTGFVIVHIQFTKYSVLVRTKQLEMQLLFISSFKRLFLRKMKACNQTTICSQEGVIQACLTQYCLQCKSKPWLLRKRDGYSFIPRNTPTNHRSHWHKSLVLIYCTHTTRNNLLVSNSRKTKQFYG